MITHLLIQNFTLIDKLDIDLHDGFSVITGETGAGKSIILGAIGLLLGQRADSKSVKSGAPKCVVEAHFDLHKYNLQDFFLQNDIEYDSQDCIIRRELSSNGKSRAFINDTPASLALLKELGERLVDVHSQHQNLLLQKQDFQLSVIDTLAFNKHELEDFQNVFAEYLQLERQIKDYRHRLELAREKADFLNFQHEELMAANLVAGEQEELERRSDTMTHSEDIKTALYTAANAMQGDEVGVLSLLTTAADALRSVGSVFPESAALAQRLESCYIEVKDVASDASASLDAIDFDPKELDTVNSRLDYIYDLEKKHRVESVEELIAIRDSIGAQLEDISDGDAQLQQLSERAQEVLTVCQDMAGKISKTRMKFAKTTELELQKRLESLGMPHVRFSVDIERQPLSRTGQDKVSFLFSANTSSPLQPIAQVASGGEIARVMLALKAMISGAVKLPTIIFDEIDTGVSGRMAEQMAQIMAEMGRCGRQVVSITHLPQIAALGSTHYKVSKEETSAGTKTVMTLLDEEGRVREIAQMLSGSDVSDAAVANARQLLRVNS